MGATLTKRDALLAEMAYQLALQYDILKSPCAGMDARALTDEQTNGAGLAQFASEFGFTFEEAVSAGSPNYLLEHLAGEYEANEDHLFRWSATIQTVLQKFGMVANETPAKALMAEFAGCIKNNVAPWDKYTIELCPTCENEVVIHAIGVTACPVCGAPLAPCSVCGDCDHSCDYGTCPYGCTGGESDDHKEPTTVPVSKETMEEVLPHA